MSSNWWFWGTRAAKSVTPSKELSTFRGSIICCFKISISPKMSQIQTLKPYFDPCSRPKSHTWKSHSAASGSQLLLEQMGSVLCPKGQNSWPNPAQGWEPGSWAFLGKGRRETVPASHQFLAREGSSSGVLARPRVVPWHKERGRTWGRRTMSLWFSR